MALLDSGPIVQGEAARFQAAWLAERLPAAASNSVDYVEYRHIEQQLADLDAALQAEEAMFFQGALQGIEILSMLPDMLTTLICYRQQLGMATRLVSWFVYRLLVKQCWVNKTVMMVSA